MAALKLQRQLSNVEKEEHNAKRDHDETLKRLVKQLLKDIDNKHTVSKALEHPSVSTPFLHCCTYLE